MKNRWISALLVVSILVGLLAACAAPAAPAPTAAPAQPAQPAAGAPTAAPAAPAAAPTAAAAAQGTIKIGFLSGLTGAYAALGQDQVRGVELAIEQAGGLVNGKKIELIKRDDKLDTQEAAKQAQQLIQNDGVKIIIGCISAATTLAINEVAKRAEVTYLGVCQTNQLNKMPDFSPYTFHIALTPYFNTMAAGPWIAKNLGKKWYFLMPDYAYGKESYEGLSKALKDNGGTEAGITWVPLAATDFTPYLPKVREAKPDVLIAGSAGGQLVNLLKQAKSFGLDKEMMIFSPMVDLAAEMELGFDNIANTYTVNAFYWELADKVPSAKKIADAFMSKYQVPPSGYAVLAYEATRFALDAMTKAGGDDPKKVAAALEGYKADYARGEITLRKCDHQNIQPVYILRGRTAQEAAAAGKDKFGFREIVASIPASESNERSCQELGLADRQ